MKIGRFRCSIAVAFKRDSNGNGIVTASVYTYIQWCLLHIRLYIRERAVIYSLDLDAILICTMRMKGNFSKSFFFVAVVIAILVAIRDVHLRASI